MKKQMTKFSHLLIAFICLTSVSILANGTGGSAGGSTSMTWEEIKASENYKADFPVYRIEKYAIPYDGLCLAPFDTVRSKKPYLVGWKFSDEGYIYQYEHVSRPREIRKRVCVDLKNSGDCVWEEHLDSIPEEQVIKINRFEDGVWKLDDTRNYQLDSCESVRNDSILI